MEKLKFVAVTIGLWVLAIFLTFDPTGNDYLKRGIKVQAEIDQVTTRIKYGNDYHCFYINDKGEKVNAYLILNGFDGEPGQKVEGYYLPEEPNTVWCEPKKGFMLAFTLIVDALAIGMTILLVVVFVSSRKEESPNIPPSYARDGSESYDTTSTADARTNPWGYSQTSTWDEKQAAKEARDEWSRQQADVDDNQNRNQTNPWDVPDTGNDKEKDDKKAGSSGLKLKL